MPQISRWLKWGTFALESEVYSGEHAPTLMRIFKFYTKDEYTSQLMRYQVRASMRRLRLEVWIAMVFVSVFAILDIYVAPATASRIIWVRFAVIMPVLILTFILTHHRNFVRFSQTVLFFSSLIVGLAFTYINHIIPQTEIAGYFYFSNLVFCIVWVHTTLRLKAELAMLISALIIIGFNIDFLFLRPFEGDQSSFIIIWCIDAYLISIYLLGIIASIESERMLSRDFDQQKIIHQRRMDNPQQRVDLTNFK